MFLASAGIWKRQRMSLQQTEEFRPKKRQDSTCENYDGTNFSYNSRNSCNEGAVWLQLTDYLERCNAWVAVHCSETSTTKSGVESLTHPRFCIVWESPNV